MSKWTTLREFNTRSFVVAVEWTYDDDYELDVQGDDGEPCQETAAKLESGEWAAYGFRAVVRHKGMILGEDSLWGSIHADPAAFIDHRACGAANREHAAQGVAGRCGSYCADMIGEAIRQAREALRSMPRVRAA